MPRYRIFVWELSGQIVANLPLSVQVNHIKPEGWGERGWLNNEGWGKGGG